ncbi:MAG TPA: 2-polyprenyl-3-methyl-6-methoxy-1,4-benzoquinone monooxygenase [Rudaea sp.]|jgi:ubiquinone biosynthesis monooxygenase Coq7|nr:2-polyprenyl-3-methyl-6-methoxy-1,4-benzoquinone monooxygenase [Rudaea sp.]
MFTRRISIIDRFIEEADRALSTTFGVAHAAERPSPAQNIAEVGLDENQRRHAAGLMRVNHTGEVCAQALYSGQAAVARDDATRAQLLNAAQEETDHLAWCADRLDALRSRPSLLNPVWYAGSFAIGAVAALVSDKVSLGFVVETERQVEAHLGEHLERLPEADAASRAVVAQMQADEARHGELAKRAGGIELPTPIPALMKFASTIMKFVAYRI